MEHPKYGTKYVCFKCGCKFYDLKKKEPLCPRCSENQKNAPQEDMQTNIRFGRLKVPKASKKKQEVTDINIPKVKQEEKEDDTEELLRLDEKFKEDITSIDANEEETEST